MIEALNTSLAFEDGGRSPPQARTCTGAMDGLQEDDILPCIADLTAPIISPCINSPAPTVVGYHVTAITQRVDQL